MGGRTPQKPCSPSPLVCMRLTAAPLCLGAGDKLWGWRNPARGEVSLGGVSENVSSAPRHKRQRPSPRRTRVTWAARSSRRTSPTPAFAFSSTKFPLGAPGWDFVSLREPQRGGSTPSSCCCSITPVSHWILVAKPGSSRGRGALECRTPCAAGAGLGGLNCGHPQRWAGKGPPRAGGLPGDAGAQPHRAGGGPL